RRVCLGSHVRLFHFYACLREILFNSLSFDPTYMVKKVQTFYLNDSLPISPLILKSWFRRQQKSKTKLNRAPSSWQKNLKTLRLQPEGTIFEGVHSTKYNSCSCCVPG